MVLGRSSSTSTECSYSINEPRLAQIFLASVLQLDLPLVSVFQPDGGRGVGLLNGRSHMKVKMLGNTPSLIYVSCRTGRVVLPIPGHVGVRRERGRPFPFTSNVPVRCDRSKVVE